MGKKLIFSNDAVDSAPGQFASGGAVKSCLFPGPFPDSQFFSFYDRTPDPASQLVSSISPGFYNSPFWPLGDGEDGMG